MKNNSIRVSTLIGLLTLPFLSGNAQVEFAKDKDPHILIDQQEIQVNYKDTVVSVGAMSNVPFTVTPQASWVKQMVDKSREGASTSRFLIDWNMSTSNRSTTIVFENAENSAKKVLTITQTSDRSAEFIKGDVKVPVASGEASSFQGGSGIELSFDGNMGTIYHSNWSNSESNYFPITLTYNFSNVDKIDYLMYHPRQSGGNGHFKVVEVQYTTKENSSYKTFGEFDFKGSGDASQVTFGEEGLINPTAIRFVVKSGAGDGQGFATCAEMEFYKYGASADHSFDVFEDKLMTKLKPHVTEEIIDTMSNLFVKRLAKTILSDKYSTQFRVGEFEPYPTIDETSSWMKTSGYDPFENPTGIYFDAGESIVVIVDNPGEEKISLKIQRFGISDGGQGSTYPLKNGINKINASHRGLGYISYFTKKYQTAPNVKVHFVMGKENGYFKRGVHNNEDWKRMLSNACSDIFDVIGYQSHVAYPTASYKQVAPNDGVGVVEIQDSIVYREHEIMGLLRYNKVPKNHMFSRVVSSGMFADGWGAGIPAGGVNGYIHRSSIDYWGIGHELGHVNQIRPGLKWVSTSEVTNNIYSAWVQFSLGDRQNLRLEHEGHGGDDMRSGIGGRFNSYMNYGVCQGNNWLMQEGPDYFGQTPFGTPARRNYDHFVKLAPLWQLQLYFHQAGFSPDFYGKISEHMRNTTQSGMDNGKLQLNFMKVAMDSTQLNLTDFFVKCGMLKPYNNVYLEDYSPGYMNITQAQVDELKEYAKRYDKPECPVIYYINGNNWQVFRDKLPVKGTYNTGVTVNGNFKRVDHSVWKNVVAFETYDSDGKLIRITMSGRGGKQNLFTDVSYPEGASRIEAIDCEGNAHLVFGTR